MFFRIVTPCIPVVGYQSFREAYNLHLNLMLCCIYNDLWKCIRVTYYRLRLWVLVVLTNFLVTESKSLTPLSPNHFIGHGAQRLPPTYLNLFIHLPSSLRSFTVIFPSTYHHHFVHLPSSLRPPTAIFPSTYHPRGVFLKVLS